MPNQPDKHRINPALASLAVDIRVLTPDPRNARSHDERNVKAVMESYRDHGQRKPVIVQRVADNGTPMVVRAGNGQCEAAKRLGWTQIAALVIDEADKDAIAFALRDNRTAELAEWDMAALSDNMRYLADQGISLDTVGWEPFESEPLLAADWTPVEKSDADVGPPPKKETIVFTPDQWLELKLIVGNGKAPTAEELIRLLKVGRVAEQEVVS
jgi:ParB-like chromosome segregation protein Spo0J